jgi:uroporphyrinogen-III synthase
LPLAGRRVAVPEARELDLLVRMLEERGAIALPCPLVAIRDVADEAPVLAWLRRFIEKGADDVVLLTGEGLRRLLALAGRHGLREAFVAALRPARKITRGPKPVRALREIGLDADVRRVAVQLYPDGDHRLLLDAITRGGAGADPVTPYSYAGAAEEARVRALIEDLIGARVDAITFTSSPQVKRLMEIAARAGRAEALVASLPRIVVAAVGPLVADALAAAGAPVHVVPAGDAFFLKPLVRDLARAFEGRAPAIHG